MADRLEQRVRLARRASELTGVLTGSSAADVIALDSGHAFPGILPDLTAVAEGALTLYRTEALQYSPRPGVPELRAWIAEYMAEDGVHLDLENVLVTNGAKHAIELGCRLLLDEGDTIVVTAPTYFTAIPIFRSFGVRFLEVGQDREGLDVDELRSRLEELKRDGHALPKFIYNVPDYHNPTGVTMSLDRRKALIDLAASERVFIIEDSPYRTIRFEGETLPSLKALDRHEIVLQVGTFSKLLAPGLRVGWVAASPDMVARMSHLKSDGGSCPLTQRMIREFGATGHLQRHVERVRETYRIHRDRSVAALRRDLPEVSMEVPRGGYYLWLTLPSGMDADELTTYARNAGVAVLPGSKCYARPEAHRPSQHIRIAYSHASPDELDEGVRRLATAFAAASTGSARPVRRGAVQRP